MRAIIQENFEYYVFKTGDNSLFDQASGKGEGYDFCMQLLLNEKSLG